MLSYKYRQINNSRKQHTLDVAIISYFFVNIFDSLTQEHKIEQCPNLIVTFLLIYDRVKLVVQHRRTGISIQKYSAFNFHKPLAMPPMKLSLYTLWEGTYGRTTKNHYYSMFANLILD